MSDYEVSSAILFQSLHCVSWWELRSGRIRRVCPCGHLLGTDAKVPRILYSPPCEKY